MALVALALAASLAAAEAPASPERLWHESDTPHFRVFYEAKLPPAGFALELEGLHSRMRFDLHDLAPWMDSEKIDVFVFASSASYAAGPFHPPPWSNGLSIPQKRQVVVFERADAEGLKRVLAHEMTHVLFESFFQSVGQTAPRWLTEGIAMTMETPQSWSDQDERNSPWNQRLVEGGKIRVVPMKGFFAETPLRDLTDMQVDDWYLQAYAVARFLRRGYSLMQYRLLCSKLREGNSVEQALWSVYRFGSLEDFQRAYVNFLRNRSKPEDRFSPTPIQPGRLDFGFH